MADRKMRILVVDDANLVRLYYRQILEDAGFEVDEALNGIEALERLLVSPPDALIVDINMPQMDGVTFLNALRRQALPLSSIPALVTSTEFERRRHRRGARRRRQFLLRQAGRPRGSRAHHGDVLRRSPMNEFLEQFLVEARELVEQATADLLALEREPGDRASLDGVFPRVSHAERRRRHRRVRSDGARDARRRGCPVDGSPGRSPGHRWPHRRLPGLS